MTQVDEENLKKEIQHIFDSGANEIRIFEMVKLFIQSQNMNNMSSSSLFSSCSNERVDEIEEKVNRLIEFTGLNTLD